MPITPEDTCKLHSGICKSLADVENKQIERNRELVRIWNEFANKVGMKLFLWSISSIIGIMLTVGGGLFLLQVSVKDQIASFRESVTAKLHSLELQLEAKTSKGVLTIMKEQERIDRKVDKHITEYEAKIKEAERKNKNHFNN